MGMVWPQIGKRNVPFRTQRNQKLERLNCTHSLFKIISYNYPPKILVVDIGLIFRGRSTKSLPPATMSTMRFF